MLLSDAPIVAFPAFAPIPAAMILHTLGYSQQTFVVACQQDPRRVTMQLTQMEKQVVALQNQIHTQIVAEKKT